MKGMLLFVVALLVWSATTHAAVPPVTNTKDSLAGSLRQAIQDAAPGETILFNIPTSDPGYNPTTRTWTITLTSTELLINKNLTISSGGRRIVIARNNASSKPELRIFNVTAGTVNLVQLTISNGYLGSAADNNGTGVRNAGTLFMSGCTLNGNHAINFGGGVYNSGTAVLTNCTFFANRSDFGGAAIYNTGNITITACTITGNSGNVSPPGVQTASGIAHVGNSVIALNTGGSDYPDAVGDYVSDGYNFIGKAKDANGGGSTGFGLPGSHDQIGTYQNPANPQLGAFQDNGGPTQTIAPLAGSPLIDQGNSFGLTTDQRNLLRPVDNPTINNAGDSADIGAVETDVAQTGPTFTVNTTDEHSDQFCGIQDCSLWDAANASGGYAANTGQAGTVTFAPNVTGIITTTLQASGIGISHPVNYVGPGAGVLTISGAGGSRIFNIVSGTTKVSISGLTIANGAIAADGGGIFNAGQLSLSNCIVSGNQALGGYNGGGIANSGSLTLTNVTVSGNSAKSGGGVLNSGSCTAVSVTFDTNQATEGGGGIANFPSKVVNLTNCTVSGNSAGQVGGGVDNGNGSLTLTNVTFSGNSNVVEGAIQSSVPISMTNTVLAKGATGPNCGGFTGGTASLSDDNTCNLTTAGDPLQRDNVPDLNLGPLANNGGFTATHLPQANSRAIDNGTAVNGLTTDQRELPRPQGAGYDVGAVEVQPAPTPTPTPTATPTATPTPTPTSVSQLQNLSTRKQVGTGDNVLIGGFIVVGTEDKNVLLRGLGPSLPVSGALEDPILELHRADTTFLAVNDNWKDTQPAEIAATGIPPTNDLESAIVATLAAKPGSEAGAGYTGILAGKGGTTGIGLLEIYDLNIAAKSKLANISTRGFVGTDPDVLIGGFIPGPSDRAPLKVLVRALGPSLTAQNVSGALQDPLLQIFDSSGTKLFENDNWRDAASAAEIQATLPPPEDRESAIITTLQPASSGYTAVVRGANNSIGVALVEVYALQ